MATRKFLWQNLGDGSGFVYSEDGLTAADEVDVQGAGIINLRAPVADQDAATKKYVDDLVDENMQSAVQLDVELTAAGAVPAKKIVYFSDNDAVSVADSSDAAKVGAIGFALAAIADTETGTIRQAGVVEGVLTGATAGRPYYLGHAGDPVLATALANGDRIIKVGYAKNATDLYIKIDDVGKK